MTDRPILFSAPMVRAILAGQKTQTRRIVKPQPTTNGVEVDFWRKSGLATHHHIIPVGTTPGDDVTRHCPYGVPGDRLWVRETFAYTACGPDAPGALAWRTHNIHGGDWEHEDGCEKFRVAFFASGDHPPESSDEFRGGWRPSIFMPRWASRITLDVTGIRVERLQDISEEDAWAEGVESMDGAFDAAHVVAAAKRGGWMLDDWRSHYLLLWESINGAVSWDVNPWVWVVEFDRKQ